MSLPRLDEMKENGEPIVMVTAYDYPSATVAEAAGVDLVLVGDSAANVVLGYDRTELVSMEEMIVLGKAVRRGLKTPLMIGDMPMGSYEASNELAILSAQRLVKETGCQAVKLEAGGVSVERAPGDRPRRHPGDGPPRPHPADGDRARRLQSPGQDGEGARSRCCEDALALQSAGCFAIVFEAVPAEITATIVAKLDIPTIGIGAGPATSGQVLVFHDLLGITTGHMAKFVKRYADVHEEMVAAVGRYADEVRGGSSPAPSTPTRSNRPSCRLPPPPRPGEPRLGQGVGVGAAELSQRQHPGAGTTPQPRGHRRSLRRWHGVRRFSKRSLRQSTAENPEPVSGSEPRPGKRIASEPDQLLSSPSWTSSATPSKGLGKAMRARAGSLPGGLSTISLSPPVPST